MGYNDAMHEENHTQESAPAPRRGRPPNAPGQKVVKMVAQVPADLHRRARIGAVIEGRSLAAVIRAMLAERYPEPEPK